MSAGRPGQLDESSSGAGPPAGPGPGRFPRAGAGSYETLTLSIEGAVATLVLDRPAAANTLSRTLLEEGPRAVDEIAATDGVRVLIVTGAGERHFCGGADLRDLSGAADGGDNPFLAPRTIFDAVEQVPFPTIATINGAALGGGCEIALACDFRILADTATIGLPEILFGRLPGGGGTARLPRIVGVARAKDMIMRGRRLDAATALSYDLVHEVVPRAEVLSHARQLADELAVLAPYALASAKHLLDRGADVDLQTALRLERDVVSSMGTPEDLRQAMASASVRSETYRRIFDTRDRP